MSENITVKKVVTHPFFGLIFLLSLWFIVSRYGSIGVLVGSVSSASVLSVYVVVLPDRFRSRSGSMMAAICLIAATWVGAAVITALTLMGKIGD